MHVIKLKDISGTMHSVEINELIQQLQKTNQIITIFGIDLKIIKILEEIVFTMYGDREITEERILAFKKEKPMLETKQSEDPNILRNLIMNPNLSKNAQEWWACHRIETLENILKRYIEDTTGIKLDDTNAIDSNILYVLMNKEKT